MFNKLLRRTKLIGRSGPLDDNTNDSDTEPVGSSSEVNRSRSSTSRQDEKRERCIKAAMNHTRWSYEEALLNINDTCKRLDLTYNQYRLAALWKYPPEEQTDAYREYKRRQAILKEEKLLEKEAANRRKDLINSLTASSGLQTDLLQKNSGSTASRSGSDHPAPAYFEHYSYIVCVSLSGSDIPSMENAAAFPDAINDAANDEDQDSFLLKTLRAGSFADYIPETHISYGEFRYFRKRYTEHHDADMKASVLCRMYIDWLFFCKDRGYDMDDYFDFEFYSKSLEERSAFISATFRENLKRKLNPDADILVYKASFLKHFSSFIKRPWIDCSTCTRDEFLHFIRENPVCFFKTASGFGAEGLRRIDTTGENADEFYIRCRSDRCVAEAPIIQHESIRAFNPDTVNSIRVVSIADSDNSIIIASAAMRFGRKGCFADNYHQGGLCVSVDPSDGHIRGDAIDRTGRHFSCHPDSGLRFDGFTIPCWNKLKEEVSAAAYSCRDHCKFIGWDLTVTSDGEIDFIEGNSRPGFGILQAPNMEGLKDYYLDITSGSIPSAELMDTEKGYWRKWKLAL